MRLTVAFFASMLVLSACDGSSGPGATTDTHDPVSGDTTTMKDGGGAGSPAKDGSTGVKPSKDGSIAVKPGKDGTSDVSSSDGIKDPSTSRGDTGEDAGGDPSKGPASDGGEPAAPVDPASPQLALSADFLNKTLTVFDVDKLKEGASKKDVMVGTVDLSKYTPGALAQAITPDGKLALVSISIGFLSSFLPGEPTGGNGMLLFVDLEKLTVVAELQLGNTPMGIAITPDGKRAFVGLLSETYIAVVDIEKRTFEKVQTGAEWNEELALDETGTVAILSSDVAGNVKTFSVAAPAMMGGTFGIDGDAAGVAFFPGTKLAYVMQSPNGLTTTSGGYNLIDVTDPLKPVSVDSKRIPNAPKWYSVTTVRSRNSVAYPSFEDNKVFVYEMKLSGKVVMQAQKIEVGPGDDMPYGVCATPDGRVLVANGAGKNVGVVDLATQKAFMVPWEQTKAGPNDIRLIPKRK